MHEYLTIFAKYKYYEIEIFSDVIIPGLDTVKIAECISDLDEFLECGIVIGCGAGLLPLSLSEKVERLSFTDINQSAVLCTISNLKRNNFSSIFVGHTCNMAEFFEGGTFDIVVSNPAQLPSLLLDDKMAWSTYAHEGGVNGREMIIGVLKEAKRLFRNDKSKLIITVFDFHLEDIANNISELDMKYSIISSYARRMGERSFQRRSLFGSSDSDEFISHVLEVRMQ